MFRKYRANRIPLEKVKTGYCFGLLTDDVTDMSALEMLITFVQSFDNKTGNIETSFLFIEDVLKNSTSAKAETIFTALTTLLNKQVTFSGNVLSSPLYTGITSAYLSFAG